MKPGSACMHIFFFFPPKTADFSHLQEGQLDRSFQVKIPLAIMLETENDLCSKSSSQL